MRCWVAWIAFESHAENVYSLCESGKLGTAIYIQLCGTIPLIVKRMPHYFSSLFAPVSRSIHSADDLRCEMAWHPRLHLPFHRAHHLLCVSLRPPPLSPCIRGVVPPSLQLVPLQLQRLDRAAGRRLLLRGILRRLRHLHQEVDVIAASPLASAFPSNRSRRSLSSKPSSKQPTPSSAISIAPPRTSRTSSSVPSRC